MVEARAIGNSEPMEVSGLTNIRGVTQTREGVVTDKELIEKIIALKPDDFKHPYYYMRVLGFCSLARRTGKRREELGLLKFSDIETKPRQHPNRIYVDEETKGLGLLYSEPSPAD